MPPDPNIMSPEEEKNKYGQTLVSKDDPRWGKPGFAGKDAPPATNKPPLKLNPKPREPEPFTPGWFKKNKEEFEQFGLPGKPRR
jgi:hypothetical protein